MIFFGLASTVISELRVLDKTKEGGHYVEPKTVLSNFFGNMEKLNTYFSIFNNMQIVDTSETENKVLCVIMDGDVKSAIPSILLPNWFKFNLPAIF
jgi:predicted ABC-type ATPase